MATNEPGSVHQNPYYDCAGCYDYQIHRAEDLRVHKNHAWCNSCWDYHKDGDEALPPWHELERFVPALQTESEKLRKDAERIEWLEGQTKKSRTGISFDYHCYAEDGYVVNRGYRFMRRHFASGFKDSLRKAIDSAMHETAECPQPPAAK